jgi:hypothetical protein
MLTYTLAKNFKRYSNNTKEQPGLQQPYWQCRSNTRESRGVLQAPCQLNAEQLA